MTQHRSAPEGQLVLLQHQKGNVFHLDSTTYPLLSPEGGGISITTQDEANKTRALTANAGTWCIFVCSTSQNTFCEASPRTKFFLMFFSLGYRSARLKKITIQKQIKREVRLLHLALKI